MCTGGWRVSELPGPAAMVCRLGGRGGRDERESGWERRWKGFMRGEDDSVGEHCAVVDRHALILSTSTSPSPSSWRVQWAVSWGAAGSGGGWGRERWVSGREAVDMVRSCGWPMHQKQITRTQQGLDPTTWQSHGLQWRHMAVPRDGHATATRHRCPPTATQRSA